MSIIRRRSFLQIGTRHARHGVQLFHSAVFIPNSSCLSCVQSITYNTGLFLFSRAHFLGECLAYQSIFGWASVRCCTAKITPRYLQSPWTGALSTMSPSVTSMTTWHMVTILSSTCPTMRLSWWDFIVNVSIYVVTHMTSELWRWE